MGGTERSSTVRPASAAKGPGGGGTVRGLEFVVYYNQMLNRIKERWTWVGDAPRLARHGALQHLADGRDHEHPLVERSGDPRYDASVERAVQGREPAAAAAGGVPQATSPTSS